MEELNKCRQCEFFKVNGELEPCVKCKYAYIDGEFQEGLEDRFSPVEREQDVESVNHPAHYNAGTIECIDAMKAAFGVQATKDFCLVSAFKYIWRCREKGKEIEDIKKAVWYLNKYVEFTEG